LLTAKFVTAKPKGTVQKVLINLHCAVNKQFVSWRKFCEPEFYIGFWLHIFKLPITFFLFFKEN